MRKTRLYIGLETKAREFEAKALLACVAAEAGYDVFLGQQKLFLKKLEQMPVGIFLNKSISPSKAKKYAHYRKLGFKLVAYDEEGLAPFNADEYQKRRVSSESLRNLERFLAWGQWQADVIAEKAPSEREKIALVGHPRIDLTRKELRGMYQHEAQRLRDRYGPFVLINTNFSFYNHFQGKDAAIGLFERVGKIKDEVQRAYYLGVRDHKKTLFYAFVEMVERLHARFPDVVIILRPHPSENHEYWRQVLPNHDKIKVVYEGNVLPWIMAAKVMIHNSCTTGIEGYLLDQPVLAYRPIRAEEYDLYLPNALSDEAMTLEALLRKVECSLLSEPEGDPTTALKKRAIALRYIASLEGSLSSDRTVEQLNRIQISHRTPAEASYQIYTLMRKMGIRVLKKVIFRQGGKHDLNTLRADYRKQKFPGIALEEVQQLLTRFQHLTGRFLKLQVTRSGENVFRITSV